MSEHEILSVGLSAIAILVTIALSVRQERDHRRLRRLEEGVLSLDLEERQAERERRLSAILSAHLDEFRDVVIVRNEGGAPASAVSILLTLPNHPNFILLRGPVTNTAV